MNVVLTLWIVCLIILGIVNHFCLKSIEEQLSKETGKKDFGKDYQKNRVKDR